MLPSQSMQAGQSRPQTPSARAYSELSQYLRGPRPLCWAQTDSCYRGQATDRDWNFRLGTQVQGRRDARCRLPRCVPPTPLQTMDTH